MQNAKIHSFLIKGFSDYLQNLKLLGAVYRKQMSRDLQIFIIHGLIL